MYRDTKFGYGFLLVGGAMSYLISVLFDPIYAVIASCVILIIGVALLISGHLHRDKGASKQPFMATLGTYMFIGALMGVTIGGLAWAAMKYYHEREAKVPQAANESKPNEPYKLKPEPTKAVPQQPGGTPKASPPQEVLSAKLSPESQPPKAKPPNSGFHEKPSTFKEKETYWIGIASNSFQMEPNKPINLLWQLGLPEDMGVIGYLENGKILLDAKLYAGNSVNPIEIKKNEFTLSNSTWDRNYNNTAFEVVNEDDMPVLQIIYKTPFNVVVYGLFQSRRFIAFIGPKGMSVNPENPSEQLKPIFKYPSRRHPGQEVDR